MLEKKEQRARNVNDVLPTSIEFKFFGFLKGYFVSTTFMSIIGSMNVVPLVVIPAMDVSMMSIRFDQMLYMAFKLVWFITVEEKSNDLMDRLV